MKIPFQILKNDTGGRKAVAVLAKLAGLFMLANLRERERADRLAQRAAVE